VNLDERAGRAAAGLRRAVRPVDRAPGDGVERFERFRESRRRNQRIEVLAVVVALVLAVAVLVGRTFGPLEHRRPAHPPATPVGSILFGDYDGATQRSHWYTVRADGSRLVDLHLTATCATWFPGGDRILVTNDRAVRPGSPLRPAVVDPDGSNLRPLDGVTDDALNLGCGDVSPDGSRIAIEGFGVEHRRDLDGIYSIRASDGGGLVRLVKGPVSPPRYSPDGTKIAFIDTTKPGVTPSGSGAAFVMNEDGSDLVRVTPWGYAFDIPSWSPDGSWIAFQKPYGQIWVVHPDGTGLHRVAVALPASAGAASPSWSPDGRWIVFSLQRSNGAAIYRVRLDGTGLARVAATPGGQDDTPDWAVGPSAGATP
jgi:Tol biopolymer transport system component